MKLNVFGRRVDVLRQNSQWKVFYSGNEGKRRVANDIVLPSNLNDEEIIGYISDLCHEWATPTNSEVSRIEE